MWVFFKTFSKSPFPLVQSPGLPELVFAGGRSSTIWALEDLETTQKKQEMVSLYHISLTWTKRFRKHVWIDEYDSLLLFELISSFIFLVGNKMTEAVQSSVEILWMNIILPAVDTSLHGIGLEKQFISD